jgi:hypothetical protein
MPEHVDVTVRADGVTSRWRVTVDWSPDLSASPLDEAEAAE